MTSFPLKTLYNWFHELVANPKHRWWIVGGTLLYLINPLDVLPDVLPIVGQLDDAMLIAWVASELSSVIKDRNILLKTQQTVDQTILKTVKIKDLKSEMGLGDIIEITAVEIP